MSPLILVLSLFFHLIATVVWIGGLVIITLLVWPEMRRALETSPALLALLTRLRRRFVPWSNFSLVVLVVTGLAQMTADPHYNGFLNFDNDWARAILLKHLVIGGMVVCGVVLQYFVTPALERASLLLERGKGDPAEWERLRRREIRLTQLNLIFALAVLGFTAWATAL